MSTMSTIPVSNIPSVEFLETLETIIPLRTSRVKSSKLKLTDIILDKDSWLYVGNIYCSLASRQELVRVYNSKGKAWTVEKSDVHVICLDSYLKD